MIEKIALVAVGGALGAALRYLCVGWLTRLSGEPAFGTLFVNVAGSLLMGICAVIMLERMPDAWSRLAPFALTGVFGGFTTFSAFSLDVMRLFESDRMLWAVGYVSGSVILSVCALASGVMAARAFLS